MSEEQILIDEIKEASSLYYNYGESKLTDSEFDLLVDRLKKINPKSNILNKLEIHESDWNYKLENLPRKLYSIKKIKSQKEIDNWKEFLRKNLSLSENEINNEYIILSPKYDGIKILNYNNNFYTRYETGDKGYNVTSRLSKTLSPFIPYNCEGELIISKNNFKNYCKSYSSSRNAIPAIFSSKTKVSYQDKVSYIKYSLYSSSKDEYLDKDKQIIYLNKLNKVDGIEVPYLKIKFKDLNEKTIIDFYFKSLNNFECDGVVLDLNNFKLRNKLGETQKYVDYCRAYKGDALFNDIKESKIIDIDYQISHYGKLTPVARIEPVVINEGVVSNVSLYNSAYVRDNNIHVNQRIEVTRKGKINPKIVKFLSNDEKYILPDKCPFCGEKLEWDENKIDLYCTNENCIENKIQKIYFFFKTIGVENFGLESIKAFIKKGNFVSIEDFFNKNKINLLNIENVGDITKKDFINELDKLKNNKVRLEKIQEGSSCFNGIASSTFKELNKVNIDILKLKDNIYYNECYNKLISIDGIGSIIAKEYLSKINKFYEFYKKIQKFIPIEEENNEKNNLKFKNYRIVFTGFRDKNLQDFFENNGGKVLSSVSSNCNYVIAKNKNDKSTKINKAIQLNIPILSIEEFKMFINK